MPVLVSVLTRKNRSCQFQVLAEGAVGTKTNFLRQHPSLGTTPAVAAGLEEKPWSLEKVVEMTDAYWRKKRDGRIAQLR